MNKFRIIVVLCCLVLSACRNASTEDSVADSIAKVRLFPSDEEVMAKVYDTTYSAPESFYVDERTDTPRSYSVYHVKDASVSYELCTDDYNEALSWETADNISRSVNGELVDSYENDRYFEFIRELSYPDSIGNVTDPTSPGFSRIFKCSYIDREGVDRNLRNGHAGIFNARPVTQELIKTYTEYMWQFTFFWPARKSVLESFSAQQGDSVTHTLVLAFLTNQGFDRCDLIEVVDWDFTVEGISGEVRKEFTLLYQFESQQVNGTPEKCPT